VMQSHADERIEFVVPSDLPLVRADAAQLERVFSNLIDNALKFSPPGAPVRVSGGAAGGRVTIRVTDFGPGIPRRDRANIFEPFFRGRADSGSGSGLGLAICRGFVEANDGQLVLQSGADRGNSFSVSLPAVHPEPDGRPRSAPSTEVPTPS
jgi:two-component system, OmpR family, sensor histidine kinase KdpD